MIGQCLERFWHMGTSISLYYFRISETPFGKPNDLILEIKHQLKISIEKRLAIKNAFQRAYSTNLENMSVHLVIKIEKFWKSNSRVIWEIKRDKFWKSKVSIEKSNATNVFSWEIKRDKFWKSKVSFKKSNATNFGNQKCYLRNKTR